MLQIRPEGYIGDQAENGFVAYFNEGSLFGLISLEDGIEPDEGKALLHLFQEGLQDASITDLATFESTTSNLIIKLNFPAHVGMALGMYYNEVLYLKTVGNGQIYLRRGNGFQKLIEGDKTASGYVNELDLAVFTTSQVVQVLGETQDVRVFIDHLPPKDIIQKLNDEDYGEEEKGLGILFVEFSSEEPLLPLPPEINSLQVNIPVLEVEEKAQEYVKPVQSSPLSRVVKIIRSKAFTFGAIIVLIGILTWSVIFGYQRRQSAQITAQIETTQVEIEALLTKAEDQAVINIDDALAHIEEARSKQKTLAAQIGESHAESVAKLTQIIDDSESKILKKETAEYDEFFDLTLENKNATTADVGIFESTIALLDKDNATIYVLELDSKSLTEYSTSNVALASQVDIYGDSIYYLVPGEGIFRFSSRTESKEVIPANGDWKTIQDMDIYSGNVYILDTGNDEIFKYLVTENGFSDATSYFGTGESVKLSEARGMNIDSSIYIATKSALLKYLSGVRDAFTPKFPQDEPQFDYVYADPNSDTLFALDKKHAAVYIMDKEGSYQKEIQADIFGKSVAIYSHDGNLHVVSGSTIFEVPQK
ncbi:MAG: hypothetical protein O3B87_01745 [bacterium]|nr:hypothetical protein [bacterium]